MADTKHAKGTLYGVSVGPGEPELLTLKAARVIAHCPVLAAPRTGGGHMVALEIARQAVDVTGKTILPLELAMSADVAVRDAAHETAARLIQAELEGGRDVALLNLGDVSIYGSFEYFAKRFAHRYPLRRVAGVPSFCAGAAAAGTALVQEGDRLLLVPGGDDGEGGAATRVYMKSGRALRALLAKLESQGRLAGALLVQNCGLPGERIIHNIVPEAVQTDYFSILIVREDS